MKHITTTSISLAVVAVCVVSSVAFAGDPIPGVPEAGRCLWCPPSSPIVKTDDNGKFTIPKVDAGTYTFTISAQDVKNMMAIAGRKYHKTYGATQGAVITLQPSSTMTVNGQKTYGPIALSVTKTTTIVIVLMKDGSISGTITTADRANK